jgi:hypothetical protein
MSGWFIIREDETNDKMNATENNTNAEIREMTMSDWFIITENEMSAR